MSKLVQVRGDDWEGIYIDERLVKEGHSIDTMEAIQLTIEHKIDDAYVIWANLKWLNWYGNLPYHLSDVVTDDENWIHPYDGEDYDD